MFAILDKDANTWLEGVEGEYVAIADRRDGTSRVSDYGGLFRHVGKLSGDATAVSMAQYERFVATFDKDRDGTLNAVEWARYAAFLMEHRSLTFGANG